MWREEIRLARLETWEPMERHSGELSRFLFFVSGVFFVAYIPDCFLEKAATQKHQVESKKKKKEPKVNPSPMIQKEHPIKTENF